MGTSPERLNKLLANPLLFTFQDCNVIAGLIGVDDKVIIDLVHADIVLKRKKSRK